MTGPARSPGPSSFVGCVTDRTSSAGWPTSSIALGVPAATTEVSMASVGSDLDGLLVSEREHWLDGPPHELFARLRGECPVHWTDRISEYPDEDGYWSITRADDV